jgi:hypothetical protein
LDFKSKPRVGRDVFLTIKRRQGLIRPLRKFYLLFWVTEKLTPTR